jgi:hypothetical protein
METSIRLRSFGMALGVCLLFFAGGLQAQQRTTVEFEKFDLNNPRTPEFKDKSHSQAKTTSQWLQVYTQYTAQGGGGRDGWLDELELRWSVLLRTSDGLYILTHAKATYQDIESDGSRRNAVVYIRPSFLRRYLGKDRAAGRGNVWVHVEAVVDGQVVGSEEYAPTSPPANNWWQARDSRQVKVMDGALLTRDKTPFAALDYDFYEHLKTTPTP